MTLLGKLLVILTTAVSILFLMWALAINQEKIHWFTDKDAGPEAIGVIDKAQAKLKDLNEGSKEAAARWAQNAYLVYTREAQRPVRRDFYRAALLAVETGKAPGLNGPPVHELVTDASGLVEPRFSGKPIIHRGSEVLDSLAGYERKIKDQLGQVAKLQEAIAKLIGEQDELTQLILGTPMKKGLRTQLSEQEQILKDARSELVYLLPFWVNRYAEHATLLRRVHNMENRLRELEKYEDARASGR